MNWEQLLTVLNWEKILTALAATGILSAVVGFFNERQTRNLETRLTLSMGLRESRLRPFTELWKLTSAFPRWPRNDTLTYAKLVEFSEELRHWYYNTGGWLLSTKSRKAYGAVQEAIWHEKTGVFAKRIDGNAKSLSSPVLPKDYDLMMECCSTLRTALTEDLESRRPGPLARELGPLGTR